MKKNGIVLIVVIICAFFTGYYYKKVDLYTAVENHPRGVLNIPAQWLIMDTVVSQDKMMLIVGYADNVSVCQNLLEMAKKDSPERNFKCVDAN